MELKLYTVSVKKVSKTRFLGLIRSHDLHGKSTCALKSKLQSMLGSVICINSYLSIEATLILYHLLIILICNTHSIYTNVSLVGVLVTPLT